MHASSSATPDGSKRLIGMRVAAISQRGPVHAVNEDSSGWVETRDGGRLLVMCDGMGGMGQGDQASRMAVDSICADVEQPGFGPDQLQQAVIRADDRLRRELCADGRYPGSTVAALYVKDGRAYVAWVGDSRVYHFRGDDLLQRTTDHRLLAEMIAQGLMTEEDAKKSSMHSVLSRSLGARPLEEGPVEVGLLQPQKVRAGDRMVLCSDGLHDHVSERTMVRMLDALGVDEASLKLVELARERGAQDDVTCLVAECREWDDDVQTLGSRWDPDLYPTNIATAAQLGLVLPAAEPMSDRRLMIGIVAAAIALGLLASAVLAAAVL